MKKRTDIGGARRLNIDINKICPTIMAVGIGSVNCSQYQLISNKEYKKDMAKPEYKVPLMSEIKDIPHNGYNVVSTFSGTGGSCLGYRMAGFKVLWANEFVPIAQESYRANHDSFLDTRDIRQIKPDEILEQTGLKQYELDMLDGSPPCQAFSSAGKREKGWGKEKQYEHGAKQCNEDLFFEYIRILKGLMPKVFVAENVSGLLKGTAKGYFLEILKSLKESGYNVKCKLLDAQWLGVPQMRQRAIFIGVRNDLNLEPAYPKPLKYYYSVSDAIDNLNVFEKDKSSVDISKYAVGKEWDNFKPGGKSKKYINLCKPHPDRPCNTVTAEGGNLTKASIAHHTEKRKFTIAELKRICAFPDDFILKGTYAQQWERLGNSVPPVMMFHIAKAVKINILDKINKNGTT